MFNMFFTLEVSAHTIEDIYASYAKQFIPTISFIHFVLNSNQLRSLTISYRVTVYYLKT